MDRSEANKILEINNVEVGLDDFSSPEDIVERLGLAQSDREVRRAAFSQAVISFMDDLGLTNHDFCDIFGVPIPTVERYRLALTMPRPGAAKYMLERMNQIRIERLGSDKVGDIDPQAYAEPVNSHQELGVPGVDNARLRLYNLGVIALTGKEESVLKRAGEI